MRMREKGRRGLVMFGSGGIVAVLELGLVLDARTGDQVRRRTAGLRKGEQSVAMRSKARADP
jgi:hypothetical protein